MNESKSPGSNWHPWDLHVHVPGTKKNDLYTTKESVEIDEFVDTLAASDLVAVGIADYFSIDLAFEVKERLERKNSEIKVFPNLELRSTETPNKKTLNYHVLFSDQLSKKEILDAITPVRVIVDDVESSVFLGSISDQDIEGAVVSISDMTAALEQRFGKKRPYIIVTASGSDGFRARADGDVSASMAQTISRNVLKQCEAIFGGAKDLSFWANPDITQYDGKKRAVYRGSDAHSLDDFKASLSAEERTWIKAEPGMSGLKETLFEPEERISIQRYSPESTRTAASVRSIRVRPRQVDSGDSEFFGDGGTFFNGGLNSIIGSRSSGKSILLALIAYGADKEETKRVQRRGNLDIEPVRGVMPKGLSGNETKNIVGPADGWAWGDFESRFSVELEWSDGLITDGEDAKRYLHYIPQGYLNDIADSPKEMDSLLSRSFPNVLGEGDFTQRAKWKKVRADSIQTITSLVSNSSQLAEIIRVETAELSELGSIKQFEEVRENLAEKLSAMNSSAENDPEIRILRDELEKLDEISTNGVERVDISSVKEGIERSVSSIKVPNIAAFANSSVGCVQSAVDMAWSGAMSGFFQNVESLLEQYNDGAEWAEDCAKRRTEQVVETLSGRGLPRLSTDVSEEHARLEREFKRAGDSILKISELSKNLEENRAKLDATIQDIIEERDRIDSVFDSLVEEFNSDTFAEESVVLKAEKSPIELRDVCLEGPVQRGQCDEWTSFIVDLESRTDVSVVTDSLLKALVESRVKIRTSTKISTNDLLNEVACSIPHIRAYAIYDNDRFGGIMPATMSAGKRAMACLELILGSENEQSPLLIDQPEDDLDSRSIADTVVDYMRNAKRHRQIVMVSHNANMVVGSDSDLVIVANQKTAIYGNAGSIRFYYGSGAMESYLYSPTVMSKDFFHSCTIREHICKILDGGKEAFHLRYLRYGQ